MRHAGERQRHLGAGERAHQREVVGVAEMADAEHLAGVLSEAHAVGNVEVLEREVAEGIRIVPGRREHRRDGRRVVLRIAAHDLEPPGAHRAAGRLGEPIVAGEHVVEALLVQHLDRDRQAVQHLGRRRVRIEADLVHAEHVVPGEERLRHLGALARL